MEENKTESEVVMPEDVCPCAACPDRQAESCVCDIEPHPPDRIKCEDCYYVDECETRNDLE